jgi:hypothetical protein
MKKSILFLLISSFSFVSCKKALKNVDDYFVKVETVDAIVQSDGSVLLKGKIISQGAAKLEYLGFCFSSDSNPKIQDNQIQINQLSGNTFETVVKGLSYDSVYYFRAWATNRYGYSLGKTIYLDSIQATPAVAPCSIDLNKVTIDGNQFYTFFNQTQYTNVDNNKVYTLSTYDGPTVTFTCGSPLTTGIFQTTTYTNPGPGFMKISFIFQTINTSLLDGSEIYVNINADGNYSVEVCDGKWKFTTSSNFTNPFKTHVILNK